MDLMQSIELDTLHPVVFESEYITTPLLSFSEHPGLAKPGLFIEYTTYVSGKSVCVATLSGSAYDSPLVYLLEGYGIDEFTVPEIGHDQRLQLRGSCNLRRNLGIG